jgi:DNA-directed RNA polymerase subunit A'
MILMKVQEHILSPRFGGPVIGAIHDHITGVFLLTYNKEKVAYFTKEEMLSILSKVKTEELPPMDAKMSTKGKEMYSGKAIFSTILPKDLNMSFKSSICQKCNQCKREDCENDAYVKIRKGVVLMGTIDEKAVGSFKGRILERISRDYGSDYARSFLDNVTRMAVGAIMVKGFTTGIDDEDIPHDARTRIEENLKESMNKVEKLIHAYHNGEMEQMPGRSMEETLEVQIMKELGSARNKAGEIAGEQLGMENAAVIMAKSGARGSMLNLSQMAGAIGQQAVRGERLKRGYAGRTLPHFQQGDLGARAKGFVTNCYKTGLTPTEFFFHSMGGREGLVDTAVRTSRSGYMQRRLINALEDLKLKDDTTVRNTADNIIQFEYGEDGIDPTRSVSGQAVDLDEIMEEVLGEKEATLIAKTDDKAAGSYATVEKDEMEAMGDEDEETTEDSIETDSGGEE